MSKKAKSKETEEVKLGAVLYTDGSAQPNPGYGGYGIHGYTVDLLKPIQIPASQKKKITTIRGYLSRQEIDAEQLEAYRKLDTIEMYGTPETKDIVNNNQMELLAIKRAFELIKKSDFKQVTILSDSQASLNSMGHWYQKWEKNGWLNSKGQEVKMKDQIIDTYKVRNEAYAVCPDIVLKYVKGHSGNFGNDAADKLAKMGSRLHQFGKIVNVEDIGVSAQKKKVDFHDLFTRARWYFMGGKQHQDNPLKIEGWYAYFVGILGYQKKDEDFGMRTGDGVSSIVLLKSPEPTLNKVETIYRELTQHDYDFVVCGRLDTVLTPTNFADIEKGNLDLILSDPVSKTLSLPNGKVVCMEYNPAHLSYIQMERYNTLIKIAHKHLQGNPDGELVYTDVYDLFVQKEEKKKGKDKVEVLYKLHPDFTRSNLMRCSLNYRKDGKDGVVMVRLVNATDLPDKVHLGRLIKNHGASMKMRMVSYHAGGDYIEFCCLIELEDGMGFWMNFNSSSALV